MIREMHMGKRAHTGWYSRFAFSRPIILFVISCIVASGCVTWNSGLKPVNPSYGYLWNAKVDTLSPTLQWEPYEETAGKEDIRYNLQLVDNGVIVLSKEDIREPSYTIDRQLDPGKKYQWLVRPVWTSSGYTHWGPWNHKKYFIITPFIILFLGFGSSYYSFTTPEM